MALGQLILWVVRTVCRFSSPWSCLGAAFLLLGVVCVPLALLLGVGGCQMSLRAGRAALAVWEVTLLPRVDQTMALCSVVVMMIRPE